MSKGTIYYKKCEHAWNTLFSNVHFWFTFYLLILVFGWQLLITSVKGPSIQGVPSKSFERENTYLCRVFTMCSVITLSAFWDIIVYGYDTVVPMGFLCKIVRPSTILMTCWDSFWNLETIESIILGVTVLLVFFVILNTEEIDSSFKVFWSARCLV